MHVILSILRSTQNHVSVQRSYFGNSIIYRKSYLAFWNFCTWEEEACSSLARMTAPDKYTSW